MDQNQNKQRRPARLTSSQAQAYLTNQHECNQRMLSPTTNILARVKTQRELNQPMPLPLPPLPTTNAQAHSTLSTIPRGPPIHHPLVPQHLHKAPPVPEPVLRAQPQLFNFWVRQYCEVKETIDFRTHALPLTRIKRIMKIDKDVSMISADACVVFSKACEIFVKELTTRSWVYAEENRRRTLHRGDIATAIAQNETFDFLIDIVPRDDKMEHYVCTGINRVAGTSECVRIAPDYPPMPLPPRNVVDPPYGHPRMIMGRGVPTQAHVGSLVTRSLAARVSPQQPHNDAPPGFGGN